MVMAGAIPRAAIAAGSKLLGPYEKVKQFPSARQTPASHGWPGFGADAEQPPSPRQVLVAHSVPGQPYAVPTHLPPALQPSANVQASPSSHPASTSTGYWHPRTGSHPVDGPKHGPGGGSQGAPQI